jgi:diadenosine tetraphosphate (Ap4A) HIT family hydrolase
MRAAVLDLAFDGLGALVARSAAFVDNPASIRVSQALGYRENGRFRQAPRGDPKEIVNFEITSEEWRSRRFSLPPVTVVGLDAVLPMFGLHEESPSAASGNVRSAGKGQIEQSACMGEGDTRDSTTKRWIDADSYARQLFEDNRAGRCFICDLIHDSSRAHLIRKDDLCIAFLPKYPTLRGRALLAPIKHRTQVVGDFSENEYLAIQRHVYRLGRAISTAFPTERLYVLSLGSNDGVAHVHWHLAPLPPGVPLAAQQFQALDIANGYLDLSENELAGIASRISRNLDGGET